MSKISRQFETLIKTVSRDDYKSCHYIMAMGIRNDGVSVFSANGAARYSDGDLEVKVKIGHAEQKLARKLDKGSEVFVARCLKAGDWALAKPCKMCRAILRSRGVVRVYYTIAASEYGVIDFENEKRS